MDLITKHNVQQTASEITGAAHAVIVILTAGGWHADDILTCVVDPPDPEGDQRYEQSHIDDYGEVRIAGAEMRAEIYRLLMKVH